MPDQQPEVVIVGDDGTEHVFPPGFDPQRAASIVRQGPTFKSSNAVDEQGNPLVRGASAFWEKVNPLNQLEGLYQQFRHPIDSTNARLQYQAEHPFEAAIANSPIGQFGGAHAGTRIASGDVAGGIGEGLGDIFNATAPYGLGKAGEALKGFANRPRFVNANPAEAAAVQFGQARGIPVDAGTATGNRFVRSAQALADHSPVGSFVAERAKAATGAALERVGGELAADVHPDAVTPEQAGGAVREGVEGLVRQFHEQATTAYDKLRSFEADPANAADVPSTKSVRQQRAEQRDIARRQEASLGRVPTDEELHEVRRIKAELDALPFVKRTWTEAPKKSGNAAGGDYDITPGAAGAPVYDDIMQHAPGSSSMTRGEVRRALDSALETGYFTNAAKGALEVAQKRIAGAPDISKPSLPPSAGNVSTARSETMLLPVDIRPAKSMLKPLMDRLARKREVVGVLMGDEARAAATLDSLISGPDHAPVSIVDAALGDIKAMARGAAMPELRSSGQGAAAQAVAQLDRVVRDAVAKAGPDAVKALEDGRQNTIAKFATADVLEQLRAEPVKGYRQLTGPKDSGITLLRQVADAAPASIPQIGRAVIEELLTKATAKGGFQRGAGVHADWLRLGPATKQILFGETVADLDRFFLLAEKIGESPNPSQSGLILSSMTHLGLMVSSPVTGIPIVVGAGALSKILHSPAAVKFLIRGMTLADGPGRVSKVAQAAAITNVLNAARTAGVRLDLPAAAQEDATHLAVRPPQPAGTTPAGSPSK